MELAKDTFEQFVNYLSEHGYPESSFGFNYAAGNQRIDLVILDPSTGLPVSLFEVKASRHPQDLEMAKHQIAAFLHELPDKTIPTFLVFPSNEDPGFEVERVVVSISKNEPRWESVTSAGYSNFWANRRSRLAKKTEDAKTKKEDSVKDLAATSWIVAGAVFILAGLNRAKVMTLDGTDLVLLGAVVGLLLLPFASKIKFFGIEFERLERARRDESGQ